MPLMMAAAGVMVDVIAKTLAELYPRTRVILNYTLASIEAEVSGTPPMDKLLHIERVINSFNYPFTVTLYFKRDPVKKWLSLKTVGNTTYLNMPPEETVRLEGVPDYSGTRFTMYKSSRYEQCVDKREGRVYVMRRLPKLPLKGLLGV